MIKDNEINAIANKNIEEHGNDAPVYCRHRIALLSGKEDVEKLKCGSEFIE